MLSEKPWKPEAVLRFFLGLFTSICLGVLVVKWLSSSYSPFDFDPKVVMLVIGTFSFHGMVLLLANAFLREHGLNWAEGFGFRSPRRGRSILLATVVGIAVLPIVLSLGQVSAKIMNSFEITPIPQETVQMLQSARSTDLTLLIGVLSVLVAPLAEEVLFRGILYSFIKQLGFPRLALWGTSLLFGAIHNNAMIFLPLTFLAVILTLLYETTDNLLAPIITHSVFNCANFFWMLYTAPMSKLHVA
ncbi:MAG: CPBP family intramembrane metalloprotease [Verrucomicrobia bacterium]|nr:CPBP family intramembrane metalloprotease [Verrucomicrobiota bacterium]